MQFLIIEDQPEIMRAVKRLAVRLGHRAGGAIDSREAIELADQLDHIDVVVADVVLGGGELGTEVVETIRERHPDCAVVFMSGHDRQHLKKVDPQMRSVFLRKPFSTRDFVAAVEDACIPVDR